MALRQARFRWARNAKTIATPEKRKGIRACLK